METNIVYQEDCIEGMKKIPSNSIDLVLTDPPYGTTACEWDKPIDFLKECLRVIKDNGCILVFGDIKSIGKLLNHKFGRYEWVWIKTKAPNFLFGSKQPLRKTEYIAVIYKHQPTYNFIRIPKRNNFRVNNYRNKQFSTKTHNEVVGSSLELKRSDIAKDQTTTFIENIIEYSNFKKKNNWYMHPTEKPLGLFKFFIEMYSNENQVVLDCFAGSGTTAIACIETNRKYICFENNPQYFKIINDRIKSAKSQTQLSNESCPTEDLIRIKRNRLK
jgi:DNA modification methylase